MSEFKQRITAAEKKSPPSQVLLFTLCTTAQERAITHAASAPRALCMLVSTSTWKCRVLSEKLILSSFLDQRVEGNQELSALLPLYFLHRCSYHCL